MPIKEKLFETTTEVRNPIEYGMTLASYVIAGANVWPWHKGFKPVSEDYTHHLYGWEPAGFLKHLDCGNQPAGDFKNPIDLMDAVRSNLNSLEKEAGVYNASICKIAEAASKVIIDGSVDVEAAKTLVSLIETLPNIKEKEDGHN